MPCDGGEGSGAGEYGDRAQSEDRAEPGTAALPTARIRQYVEDVGKIQQAVGVVGGWCPPRGRGSGTQR